MKPKRRSLKQGSQDARFIAGIRWLLGDPLRQRLADRIRSGKFVCGFGLGGELLLLHLGDWDLVSDFCKRCGCTHTDPCEGGCSWAAPGLCTACLTSDEISRRV